MSQRQSDFDLLQAFVRHGEQRAFGELVRRHLDLVYATAFSKVKDPGTAQEVAQNVFAVLARKAWSFSPDDSLPAWLYKTTLLAAKQWLRGELRRRRREQTAAELGTTMKAPDDQPAFHTLVPLLDEGLLALREIDRTALLLRFYENESLREVGVALGVGEDAAQKRVAAALGKLAAFFHRRGYKTATVAVIAAGLQYTATPAPAAIANSILLAAGQMTPPALLGLAALVTRFASLTKLQSAAVGLSLAVMPVAWQAALSLQAQAQASRFKAELDMAQTELSKVQAQIDLLNEKANRLDASITAARESADRQAADRRKFAAWKDRLRAQLMAVDYRWPEDSPFVRIPKSALAEMKVWHPVTSPGVLKPATRELLGLTLQEHEQIEAALHRHFAAIDNLVEETVRETDKGQAYDFGFDSTIASHSWSVAALGGEVNTQGEELLARLQEILGDERGQLIKMQLQANEAGSWRAGLNLDDAKANLEVSVLIGSRAGRLSVGYWWRRSSGWGSGSDGGSGGNVWSQPLDLFTADETVPSEFLDYHDLPDALKTRMKQWIRQQAVQLLGKESDR